MTNAALTQRVGGVFPEIGIGQIRGIGVVETVGDYNLHEGYRSCIALIDAINANRRLSSSEVTDYESSGHLLDPNIPISNRVEIEIPDDQRITMGREEADSRCLGISAEENPYYFAGLNPNIPIFIDQDSAVWRPDPNPTLVELYGRLSGRFPGFIGQVSCRETAYQITRQRDIPGNGDKSGIIHEIITGLRGFGPNIPMTKLLGDPTRSTAMEVVYGVTGDAKSNEILGHVDTSVGTKERRRSVRALIIESLTEHKEQHQDKRYSILSVAGGSLTTTLEAVATVDPQREFSDIILVDLDKNAIKAAKKAAQRIAEQLVLEGKIQTTDQFTQNIRYIQGDAFRLVDTLRENMTAHEFVDFLERDKFVELVGLLDYVENEYDFQIPKGEEGVSLEGMYRTLHQLLKGGDTICVDGIQVYPTPQRNILQNTDWSEMYQRGPAQLTNPALAAGFKPENIRIHMVPSGVYNLLIAKLALDEENTEYEKLLRQAREMDENELLEALFEFPIEP